MYTLGYFGFGKGVFSSHFKQNIILHGENKNSCQACALNCISKYLLFDLKYLD